MADKRVSLLWTKHLSEEHAKQLVSRLVENQDLLETIKGFIDVRIANAREKQLSEASFSVPAWAENQAYLNGIQKALEELKILLTIRD